MEFKPYIPTFYFLLHSFRASIFAMSAIGSLVFCTDCGNLLDNSKGDVNAILVCDCCGVENRGKEGIRGTASFLRR